jgi:hypothetical protein
MCRVLAFVARQPANAFAGPMSVHRSGAQPMPDTVGEQPLASADYTVENKGTLLLLRSSNPRAYEWLVTHTDPDAHWFGRALVVEHGYIDDFVDRLRADGFTVVDI